MLKRLQIENYVLIEKLEIDFEEGLTVITGETGAGKSIIIGALSMILGQRADTQVLSDESKKCIIEGSFLVDRSPMQQLFEQYHLDYDPISIFRREITPQGKSRAFVNDTPVTLSILKNLTEKIIDIHSQHQNLLLGDSSFQFDVIDGYVNQLDQIVAFRKGYQQIKKNNEELQSLLAEQQNVDAEQDYCRFQFDELDKANLDAVTFRKWESELELFRHAEEVKRNVRAAHEVFSDGEMTVVRFLHDAHQQIKALERFGDNYKSLAGRMESVLIESKDIAGDLEKMFEGVELDPGRTEELELKVDSINRLLMKHHVQDVEGLIEIRNGYEKKLNAGQNLSERIAQKSSEIEQQRRQLMDLARSISSNRRMGIPTIEKQLKELLKSVGMPGATFIIQQKELGDLSVNGTDQIDFLFSANTGSEAREIARVASGGELSRLMLCIKSMLSRKNLLPSIIFDEIDTGISGETVGRIADIMLSLSDRMQVIAITHLPQIAAKAKHHLLVYKLVDKGKTKTMLCRLSDDERIGEIAKMMGGSKPTENMLLTAAELIRNK